MPIVVNENLSIPDEEVTFTASRSGGPGGQHVNKVSTRVTLLFDVVRSPTLSADQKRRVLEHLFTRISRAGVLRVVASKERTQRANLEAARRRLADLLRRALHRPRARVATRPTAASGERRLEEKRRRAFVKRLRAHDDEDRQ